MKVIGLTGGIASGKSTVTKMLREMGARTASADEDARAVLAPGTPTLARVQAAFPECFAPDGTLDRAKLGSAIFGDADARARLEALMHPAIFERMQQATSAARAAVESKEGILVYEVPLLFEKERQGLFDAVIAVVAPPEVQSQRLQGREAAAGRPPLTSQSVAERLAAQLPTGEKARRADYVIHSDVPLEQMRADVALLWQTLTTLPPPLPTPSEPVLRER